MRSTSGSSWGRTGPQLAVLHFLHEPGGFGATQQALHVAEAGAEAHAANAHAPAEAVGALHKLVGVLHSLPRKGAPLTGAPAHVTRRHTCAQALLAQRDVLGHPCALSCAKSGKPTQGRAEHPGQTPFMCLQRTVGDQLQVNVFERLWYATMLVYLRLEEDVHRQWHWHWTPAAPEEQQAPKLVSGGGWI